MVIKKKILWRYWRSHGKFQYVKQHLMPMFIPRDSELQVIGGPKKKTYRLVQRALNQVWKAIKLHLHLHHSLKSKVGLTDAELSCHTLSSTTETCQDVS